MFLLVTGQNEEALKLAKLRADERFDDAYAKGIYALFLYLVRRFEEARAVVKEALDLDHNCWPAYLALVLVRLSDLEPTIAFGALYDLQRSIRRAPDDYVFPGLTALCVALAKSIDSERKEAIANTACDQIAKEKHHACIQLSLLCMSGNEIEHAVNALEHAWNQGDPVILLIHLLPLFDPLRESARFQRLLERRLESPFEIFDSEISSEASTEQSKSQA